MIRWFGQRFGAGFRAAPGWLAALGAAMLLAACNEQSGDPRGPVVLAAASLQEALGEAADEWAAESHPRPVLSFAGTPALARQVEGGAPADIFISADEAWMERLARDGLVDRETIRPVAGNTLVLVARRGSPGMIDLSDPASLAEALGEGRLAMADPASVPAGRYGRAALEQLGLWDALSGRIAAVENVRAALALVERGAAPLGIVYATDAKAAPPISVVASFPPDSHPPISYPAALLTASDHPQADGLLAFLASPDGQAIFARHGFERAP